MHDYLFAADGQSITAFLRISQRITSTKMIELHVSHPSKVKSQHQFTAYASLILINTLLKRHDNYKADVRCMDAFF